MQSKANSINNKLANRVKLSLNDAAGCLSKKYLI